MVVGGTRGSIIAEASFDSNNTRTIKGANVYFKDAYGDNIEVEDIYLTITDSEDSLEVIDTDDISVEDGYIYYVEEIDITGYPSGDITLVWNATLNENPIDYTEIVEYSSSPGVIITAGFTATKTSNKVVLDQPHVFNIILTDSAGNKLDGNLARLVIYDTSSASIKETINGTLQATGSGFWSVTHTLSSSTYSQSKERYYFYWEWQSLTNGVYGTVDGSLEWIEIYSNVATVKASNNGFCSIQDIRNTFPAIDEFMSISNTNQGDRELILQQAIVDISGEIEEAVWFSKVRHKHKLLKQYCVWKIVFDMITTQSISFARQPSDNQQLKNIRQKIFRIEQSLFGHNRRFTISPPR